MNETRWKQRFINLDNAFKFFETAVRIEELSALEMAGLVKAYEVTFELAWKTLKDYLEFKEIPAQFPRDIIKTAFQAEILADGEVWIEMLDNRNLLVHTYDGNSSMSIIADIKTKYYFALKQLLDYLRSI